RIERQRGRLAEKRKDWPTALAAFDQGIRYLQRSAIGNLGTASEPAIAEARLERAGVLARSGASADQVRRDYAGVVDALIAANSSGTIVPTGLETYLDLLVGEAARTPRADTYDLFFRALQAGGQPGVARQLNQLQTVVAADPALAQLIQDRAGIERDLTRLRYALADNEETPGESTRTLEQQRVRAEARLLAINAALSRNPRYRAVDDSPAAVADIRAALKPGEGYLKLFQLSNRLYGIYVTQSQTFIYTVAKSAAELDQVNQVASAVRGSIDGRLQDGQLVPYDVARSHVLFRIVAGPARETMMQMKALIVDPAGPLTTIPIGALVTEFDPKVVREDPFDFSQTAFLAARSTISTALSPRSFLVARDLAPSHAPREFIGFGAHIPPAVANTDRVVDVGFGCTVDYNRLAGISRAFTPIDRRELTVAAQALGDPQAPLVTAADFTDTAIERRGDLSQYQILHFATHGLQEGQWGCAKSPPALVTSFGDAQSDGLLSFSEIAQLRLDANLVVLSACDTIAGVRDQALARASGQEESGSTLEGLVRAFLAANARSVMATYWPVSAEQESIDLMREFYAAARTQTIGQSLQTAQRTLMREPKYSHPFYWAPYFIVGDSTKPMLTPSARPQLVAAR
ncbi:MAG: CHAT domain-containing protein, partial [Sphingomonas sp.]